MVTMGLLSLPTMLRNGYSPKLATGVISASGTLGQIIPPSIVIIILGTLAGEIYLTAQEERARSVGCSDALTFLGEPAVISVGTLFQAALLPGIMLLSLRFMPFAMPYCGRSARRTSVQRLKAEPAAAMSNLCRCAGGSGRCLLMIQQFNVVGSGRIVDSYLNRRYGDAHQCQWCNLQ